MIQFYIASRLALFTAAVASILALSSWRLPSVASASARLFRAHVLVLWCTALGLIIFPLIIFHVDINTRHISKVCLCVTPRLDLST